MKKISTALFALLMAINTLKADEGMWIPMLLKGYPADQMAKMGLKLTPEQIYDINHSSMKDAIAWFNNGCTSEIISDQGLLLTNHHCGYGAIQSLSTDNNNILKYGFWAKNTKQELFNTGVSISILVRMEDISAQINTALAGVSPDKYNAKFAEVVKPIIEKAKKEGVGYDATVRSFYKGNEFYLFVFEKFTDVRLVGTPPEAIGKFGGDTDNWMWPRHTGDFSMFRIYANKDNKPAAYSPDNIPYKPRHSLPVSIKGVKDGDFAMVYGFPGRTNRYETSYGVKLAIDENNPAIVKLRTKRLELMKEQMDADSSVDLQLSSRYAQIANYWKYYIGQTEQLKRLKVYEQKAAEEAEFQKWATDKTEYKNVLANIKTATEAFRPYSLHGTYLNEGIYASTLVNVASMFMSWEKAATDTSMKRLGTDTSAMHKAIESISASLVASYKLMNKASDKKIFAAMLWYFYKDIPKEQHPALLKTIFKKGDKEEAKAFAKMIFEKSMFSDSAKVRTFLAKPSLRKLQKDPAFRYIKAFTDNYNNNYLKYAKDYIQVITAEGKAYMKALREMQPNKVFYPDANSTLRLTYGTVKSYDGKDAVHYEYMTHLSGVMEKEQPGDDEFEVPAKLKQLYQKKDFGRYAENGDVPVAFITTTDITGGNSGSPVINGNGELIGLAFDGNWEAMSGDIAFDPKYKRTISVDIRYVLFIVEKYGEAANLIDEIKLVN
jgi:hypothetical protein